MKVTEEMLDKAMAAIWMPTERTRLLVRSAMEAALAGVRDPSEYQQLLRDADVRFDEATATMGAELMSKHKRAEAAEVRLAKVREWAEFYTPETWGELELWDILESDS